MSLTHYNNDKVNTTDMTVILYKSNDINDFIKKSIPNAEYSEYQCHYFAVVQQIKLPNGNLNMVYPILYYNYPQQVAGASVDAEWKDISKFASEYYEFAQTMFQSTIIKLENTRKKSKFKTNETSYTLTLYNNIHKHP